MFMDEVVVFAAGLAIGHVFSPYICRFERWLGRKVMCRLGMCGGKIVNTEHGISWMCSTCGKISGFTSSQKLRELPVPGEASKSE
jgi:hypothetical protein